MNQNPRILVVDDEEDIVDLLRYNLEKEGFDVVTAFDGVEALEKARESLPDLVILDIMMPRMGGIETCRRIREDARLRVVPVLMLTAKEEDEDHVSGLESGADIYLRKPISMPVLLSQVRAMLRSSERTESPGNIVRIHDLVIDRDRFIVTREGVNERAIQLPRKEFELLYFLAARPGRVFSRQKLLDRVWGSDVFIVDRTIDVHVRKIREKIGDTYIETVKGVGYRFKD